MRILYTFLFYLFLPAVLVRLVIRATKDQRYLARCKERFGFVEPTARNQNVIWIHAVSAGESIAVVPLIRALMTAYPDYQILVTNMTPTGAERIESLLGTLVTKAYMPYDLPDMIGRFLDRIQPKLLIVVDTELWPNTIAICNQRGIKVILVNGRMSERSARGYARIGSLTRRMLAQMTIIAAQTVEQGERFIALGLPPERLVTTGSIKFDLQLADAHTQEVARIQKKTGSGRWVVVAGSTHAGEEEIVLASFKILAEKHSDMLLILVPRHPERFSKVVELVERAGMTMVLHSAEVACEATTQVIVVDAMGVLLPYYGAADVAFIGGSLVPVGGHNMMEAAEFGLPLIMGPHRENVEDIAERFIAAGAMLLVSDEQELTQVLQSLRHKQTCVAAGRASRAVMDQNRGALQRTVELIQDSL